MLPDSFGKAESRSMSCRYQVKYIYRVTEPYSKIAHVVGSQSIEELKRHLTVGFDGRDHLLAETECFSNMSYLG